jgi:hypothetical protein
MFLNRYLLTKCLIDESGSYYFIVRDMNDTNRATQLHDLERDTNSPYLDYLFILTRVKTGIKRLSNHLALFCTCFSGKGNENRNSLARNLIMWLI